MKIKNVQINESQQKMKFTFDTTEEERSTTLKFPLRIVSL